MAKKIFLDFEQSIAELENKIEELRYVQTESAVDISTEIDQLAKKSLQLTKDVYSQLTPWQITKIARHAERPYTLDYVNEIFTHFVELHGDRHFADDLSIVGGLARFNGTPCMVLGQQKGRDTKERGLRNFGMSKPEGYRKALRLMKTATRRIPRTLAPTLFLNRTQRNRPNAAKATATSAPRSSNSSSTTARSAIRRTGASSSHTPTKDRTATSAIRSGARGLSGPETDATTTASATGKTTAATTGASKPRKRATKIQAGSTNRACPRPPLKNLAPAAALLKSPAKASAFCGIRCATLPNTPQTSLCRRRWSADSTYGTAR